MDFRILNLFVSEPETQNKSMNFIEKTCPFIFQGHGHHFPLHPLPFHPHFTFPSLPFATSSPKNPFPRHGLYWSRPPPRRWPPAAAGPRCRGPLALHSAATSSLGAPAGVAETEGPVSCMVRWFFPKRRQSDEKIFVALATGLGSTGKPALTSHSWLMPEDGRCALPVTIQILIYCLCIGPKKIRPASLSNCQCIEKSPSEHCNHGLLANYAPLCSTPQRHPYKTAWWWRDIAFHSNTLKPVFT